MKSIYKSTNLVNGKCYVGQTMRIFKKRQYDHIYRSDNNLDNVYFHNAIKEYGPANFKWEILYECDDALVLGVMETMKIIVNHSHWTEGGYNLTWGGGGSNGYKHSKEAKEKISKIHKDIPLSESHKNKIGKGNKGKIISFETREKMRNAQKGDKNHNYNISPSLYTRDMISKAQKNIPKYKNRRYSSDVVELCIIKYGSGMEYYEISKELNIPVSTMQYWFKKRGLVRRVKN